MRDPGRTCVACRMVRPKSEMIRVARRADGSVYVDAGGKGDGRGAYVCDNPECVAAARKRGALGRQLRAGIPPEIYDALEGK